MELHMELFRELHMEIHMDFQMDHPMELHIGSMWSPIEADRRSPSMHIPLQQNKTQTPTYMYIDILEFQVGAK